MAHYAHTIVKHGREAHNSKKLLLPDKRRFEEKLACVTEQINMNKIMGSIYAPLQMTKSNFDPLWLSNVIQHKNMQSLPKKSPF